MTGVGISLDLLLTIGPYMMLIHAWINDIVAWLIAPRGVDASLMTSVHRIKCGLTSFGHGQQKRVSTVQNETTSSDDPRTNRLRQSKRVGCHRFTYN